MEMTQKNGKVFWGEKKEIRDLKMFPNFQWSSSRRQDKEIISGWARRGFEWILIKI